MTLLTPSLRLVLVFTSTLLALGVQADIATDKAYAMVPAIKEIARHPEVITAIKEQNERNEYLEYDAILKLDKEWRSETKATDKPFIDKVLASGLSKHLKSVKTSSDGVYTEIIVMDNKGLNVGQSDATSDYWQGDEDKWKKTYLVGADAVNIGEISLDESSKSFQSQISVPVIDPESGKVIGATTVGVFVNSLLN